MNWSADFYNLLQTW